MPMFLSKKKLFLRYIDFGQSGEKQNTTKVTSIQVIIF